MKVNHVFWETVTWGKQWIPVGVIAMVLLATSLPAWTQQKPAEPKVMGVISVAPYDSLMRDIKYFCKLIEQPDLQGFLENVLDGGPGAFGMDKTRPFGLVVMSNEKGHELEPRVLVFLPIEDFKKFLGPFQNQDIVKHGNGIYEFPDSEIYLKNVGKWIFATYDSKEILHKVPAKLLDDLPSNYDIAARAYVQKIPNKYSEMAIEEIHDFVAEGMPGLYDDDVYERVVRAQVNSIFELINEAESVTLGLNIDSEKKTVYVDLNLTGSPDSKLAKQANKIKGLKSNFSGFTSSDEALTFRVTTDGIDKRDINQAITMLEAFRGQVMIETDKDHELPDDAAHKLIKDAVGQLLDVISATIKDGSFDGAGMVMLDKKSLTAAAGARVANGAEIEEAFKKNLATVAKDDKKKFKGVNWDAAQHKDIQFHTAQIPIDEEIARQVFGDQLDVVIGIGEKSVYIALGKDPLETLKKAIDASEAAADEVVLPVDIKLSVGKILTFVASQSGGPMVEDADIAYIARIFSGMDGKDHVKINLSGIKNGFRYRIEAEEGIFRAIGAEPLSVP